MAKGSKDEKPRLVKKGKKQPNVEIQETLDIPGDEFEVISPVLKRLAKKYVEAMVARVDASAVETEAKKAVVKQALAEDVKAVPLPNGGMLKEEEPEPTPDEPVFKYVPPKPKKEKKEKKGHPEDNE